MANSSWFKPYDATKDKNSQYYKPPKSNTTTNTYKPPTNTYTPTPTPKKENNYVFNSSVPKPDYNTPNYVTSDNDYSGGSYGANSYMALLKKQEQEQKRAAELARQAAEDARKASYAAGSKALGLSAEDALRQAYISKTQAQGYLPQQSALMGAGGMTESSLAQLNAGYGNNRASIEAAKIGGLADLESQLQQGLAGDVSAYQNELGKIGSQSMTAQLAYQQKLEDIARQERYAAEEARAKASTASRAYTGRVSGGNAPKDESIVVFPETPHTVPVTTPPHQLGESAPYYDPALEFYNAMENRLKTNPANKYFTTDQKNNEIAYAIQSQLHSGRLTASQAQLLAQKYGITIQ